VVIIMEGRIGENSWTLWSVL